ncbi:hypothetical protein EDD86DRAFT_211233 [Gorgonomyces haynaldii]|nr:hypothetical protein EDD86DRAFT_211233 [Gorgonomyces haynaldii]
MLGVIPQAKCLPLPELSQAFSLDPKQFLKKYKFEKPDKAASLIFYCQAGVRSAKACVLAEEHGFQK